MADPAPAPLHDPPAELLLQPSAWRTLRELVPSRRSHALMLSGEPGNGPAAAAGWIVAEVLCRDIDDPAARAQVVQRSLRGSHPDLVRITAEGDAIRVAEVDAAVGQLVRKPFEAAAQVVVIEGAESLGATNAEAANRLLKVLEEPPGEVVFVLLARYGGSVLQTIRSRVIEVAFPRLPDHAVREWLATTDASGGLPAGQAARVAAGSLERARELAGDGPALRRRRSILQLSVACCEGRAIPSEAALVISELADAAEAEAAEDAEERLAAEREMLGEQEARRLASASAEDGHPKRVKRIARRARQDEVNACLDELALTWRDLLALASGAGDALVGIDAADELARCAATPAGIRAAHALDAISSTRARLSVNAQEATALASLFTELDMLARGRVTARRALGPTPSGSIA